MLEARLLSQTLSSDESAITMVAVACRSYALPSPVTNTQDCNDVPRHRPYATYQTSLVLQSAWPPHLNVLSADQTLYFEDMLKSLAKIVLSGVEWSME